ncbi:MAG: ribonuclease D [Gammaproteobacteria bacterium]|nr:ribonuclease D [Gammaproteobacteria bacterium]
MTADWRFVDTPELLSALIAGIGAAPWVVLDTEFVRERTYFAQLCLVQLATPDQVAIVDACALDVRPLLAAVEALPVDRVFHAAGQDLELWVQLHDTISPPLFDTQIAAALLGYGDQLSYAALVERLLGIRLDKSLTRTDWSVRPLSAAALDYAADDVRYLARIYPQLLDLLAQRGRLDWLREECSRLADPTAYRPVAELAWQRLRGFGRLRPDAARAACALAAWRERTAVNRNRPRRWILDDPALLTLAERRPEEMAQLQGLLPPATAQRHGAALLAVLRESRQWTPPASSAPLDEQQKQRFEQLRLACRHLAERLELPPSLLATRSELEALARDAAAPVRLRKGWRAQFAAELGVSA